MRLSVVWMACFACGGANFDSNGRNPELVTIVKPAPVRQISDLWQPTPMQLDCGSACAAAAEQQAAEAEPAVEVTAVETDIACAGLPARIESPFAERSAIDRVEPLHEQGQLVGARIVFKRDRAVTADSMRRELACQRARYDRLGAAAAALPTDPTLIEGADTNVIERAGRVEVIVTTPTPDGAELVLARARNQPTERTARR